MSSPISSPVWREHILNCSGVGQTDAGRGGEGRGGEGRGGEGMEWDGMGWGGIGERRER